MARETALPIDPRFYSDLFGNVSKAGIRPIMFEQDWLHNLNVGGFESFQGRQ